jgi:leucyl-tRNA synthetase
MILGEGGEKMSKSRGNVVNPNDIVAQYGADTLRVYVMFIGDFTKAAEWSAKAVAGCKRFLDRVWNLCSVVRKGDELSSVNEKEIHRTIQKVTGDIDEMKFNTALAQLMSLVNQMNGTEPSRGDVKILLQLLSPFAPHMVEELWQLQGFEGLCCQSAWPKFDESKMVDTEKTIAVQINGKLRDTVVVPAGSDKDAVLAAALQSRKIAGYVEGMDIVKVIHVPDKLINLILKPKK